MHVDGPDEVGFQQFVVSSIFLRVDRVRVTYMLELSQQGTASICTRRQDRDLLERS